MSTPLRLLLACFLWLLALPGLNAQTFSEVWLPSSYDGVVTRSVVMEPASYDGTPRPLVICLHGMGGDGWSAINTYSVPANGRGWLAAAPDQHGENDLSGQNALAARAAQADIMDLVAHMQGNWSVDPQRIYLTGGSMGGMTTTIMAAKFPDRFAAAAEWFGPADLFQGWDELWWGSFRANMRAEIGGSPSQFPWEYERRSPIHYAPNLRHVPFAIGQGRFDFVVAPHHSRDLAAAINSFQPQAFYGIHWNNGAHFMLPGDNARTLDFLSHFRLGGDPPDILFRSDEDQSVWWMSVSGAAEQEWREVAAIPSPGSNSLQLQTANAASITIDTVRAGLDVFADLEVVFAQTVDATFRLSGLDPGHSYRVERGGQPWPDFRWDPLTGTLEVDVLLSQSGPTPFLIR